MTQTFCGKSQDNIENALAQRILYWGQIRTKMQIEGCLPKEAMFIKEHINNLIDALYKFQELRGGK
jgi:hypothetical protein